MASRTFIYIGNGTGHTRILGHLLNIEGCQVVFSTPSDFLSFVATTSDTARHDIVVAIVYQHLSPMEEQHLLHAFLLHGAEVLLMSSAQGGQYANGGLDDVCQLAHLVGLTDACLKKGYLVLLVQQPDAEGYANLRVVALG